MGGAIIIDTMVQRIYIDNFRCFTNFELQLGQRALLLGANGSGKSSLMEALHRIRQFVVEGRPTEECFPIRERTRWMTNPRQTFEVDIALDDNTWRYRLVTEPIGVQRRPRVVEEIVTCNGQTVFAFVEGEVRLYNDRFEHKVTFHSDWHRSALAIVTPRPDNQVLARLLRRIPEIRFFRPNPFAMRSTAETEDEHPRPDLSNFAAWYRHLRQAAPDRDEPFREAVEKAMQGFRYLRLSTSGLEARILEAEFSQPTGSSMRYLMEELSEGQRCLLALYAILHFQLREGGAVFLDEPDNFIALREIQPWLSAADEVLDQSGSQLVIVSHHPEVLNQWAPDYGILFFREPNGPVRTRRFPSEFREVLTPSEVIARGWEHE